MAALLWTLAARVLGPSDIWDQSQPKTVAYTTDIIVNGRWALPAVRGEEKATKPPLYNWLAVPVVKLMGFSSDLAHKSPSVGALCLCWLVVVRLGRRLGADEGETLGWLAGLMLVANYTFFKLGYLARPDMVLTLWLLLGWVAATRLLIDAGPPGRGTRPMSPAGRRGLRFGFWLCVGLAGLTKGPAVLPILVYALVAARLIGGRWRAVDALRWWWGLPLSALVVGAWVYAVWRIDPAHLRQELWANEIAGRVTGLGPEGSREGPIGLLKSAPHALVYYLVRFLPWSVPSILAAVALWRRVGGDGGRRWRTLGGPGAMLYGAAIFAVVTVAIYTLTASKRADYVAAAFAPGALLAAWWLLARPPQVGVRAPWLAPAAAVVVLAALTCFNHLELNVPEPGFGDAVNRFIREVEARLRVEPRPTAFLNASYVQVQGYLGSSSPDGTESVRRLIEEGRPLWLLAGGRYRRPDRVRRLFVEMRLEASLSEACRSPWFDLRGHWPREIVLYRVEPAGRKPPAISHQPSVLGDLGPATSRSISSSRCPIPGAASRVRVCGIGIGR
jgi:4-amino-4-deoxy-L-arabinose transferase-like glycosyltransferase